MDNSPEILSLSFGPIEVRRRSRQRNMNLSVRPDGAVRVSCNRGMSKRQIVAFVESCRGFIDRRRAELAELEQRYPRPRLLSGEDLLWFGDRARLDVVWIWNERVRARIVKQDGCGTGIAFEILAPLKSTTEERHAAVVKIYRREARLWLAARVRFFAGLMGVAPRSLSVRGQKTLWGSCTGEGAISLNWKLLCCPREVIDYVVIHELAHIPHRNHSTQFWNFVSRFDPDYKKHRAYLKSVEPMIGRMFP